MAWSIGAGPGSDRLVVDLDSTICEVCGQAKHGAGYGYTKELGYHPLVATRAGTGELLHVRMRKGSANTQRGTKRFIEELVARLRRAGATGELVMRFDSGFWLNATIATLGRLSIGYTMGVRMVKSVVTAVSAIDEGAWTPIDYTCDGMAEVAECTYKGRRLIVRRTRLVGRQATLWPEWRHFAFLTDQPGTATEVDAFHRAHATVELAIKDLKEGAGMEHVPSGNFSANAAWLVCAALAHDLIRWSAGRDHSRGPPRRGPHGAHPVLVGARADGQQLGHADAACSARVAVGESILSGSRTPSGPSAGPCVVVPSAAGAPQTIAGRR